MFVEQGAAINQKDVDNDDELIYNIVKYIQYTLYTLLHVEMMPTKVIMNF